MNRVNLFNFIILIVISVSCSTPKIVGETEAETLFNDIQGSYKSKRYMLALEKIATFRSKYPYSFYSEQIELLRADIFYEQETGSS